MTTAEMLDARPVSAPGSSPRRVWIPALGALAIGAAAVVALDAAPLGTLVVWILQLLPIVVIVAVLSTAMVALLGAAMGLLAAHQGRTSERALSLALVAGHVIPVFWVTMAITPHIAGFASPFPAVAYVSIGDSVPGWLASISVPLIALTLGSAAVVARPIARISRDLLRSDLVRTLRSRGLPHRYIVRVHVSRRCVPASVQPLSLHGLGLVGAMLAMEAVAAGQGGPTATAALVSAPIVIALAVFAVAIVAVVVIDLARGTRMGIQRCAEKPS